MYLHEGQELLIGYCLGIEHDGLERGKSIRVRGEGHRVAFDTWVVKGDSGKRGGKAEARYPRVEKVIHISFVAEGTQFGE